MDNNITVGSIWLLKENKLISVEVTQIIFDLVAFKKYSERGVVSTRTEKTEEMDRDEFLKAYTKISEGDSECEDTSDTNYIKMDGEKASFEGGAIRYTKTGKGRFDLIPTTVVQSIIESASEKYFKEGHKVSTTKADIITAAYQNTASRYYDTIINIVIYKYADAIEVDYDKFIVGFCRMLRELAVHYENGAEKYGIDNWKKGIPLIGGDRGGSFTDSGLRHLAQYLSGETDEPHHIACIWNFFGAIWSMQNGVLYYS